MAERRVYKPADGVEARVFEAAWCECCARHAISCDEAGCAILMSASVHDADHPRFPVDWIIGDDGPECMAFAPAPVAHDAPNHPDYARGFLDAMTEEPTPRESGYGYFAGYFSGLATRVVFDRAHVVVRRGGAGVLAEAGR